MGVTVAHPSYALRLADQLRALHDPAGRPYRARDLFCVYTPHAFDEDAPANVKASAARACSACPAQAACTMRALELGPGDGARGVWGGQVMPKPHAMRRRGRYLPDEPPSPIVVVS